MKKTDRDAVIEHATQMKRLVHDPNSFVTELLVQQQQYYCIEWLCHFDVLSRIPLPPDALPYAEVAARANVPVSTLRSVARMAMTVGFLCETKDGHLSHSPLSASFVENVHLRTELLQMFSKTVPLMAGLTPATEKWGDTTAPNETAYNLVHKTDLPFFQHLESRPDLSDGFSAYMKSRAVSHTGLSAEHLLDAFDWKSLGEATVVDVGGSSGSTATMLATTHPKLKLVVQDLPGPISNARSQVLKLSEDVKSRISIMEYDFFTPQPVRGADIYLLRTILHDWPDTDAVKILRRIVEAMGPSSRLLIMDVVLPKPGSGPTTFEATLRQRDLTMIQAFNAKEREADEWSALLTQVESRLIIHAIERPEGSELSVIEARLGSSNGVESATGANEHT
ncbi:O-methyltransferase-domain-containing protein [Ilyonectria robusta]|uniref:O-methyltransferase-domain-containing protein n=1 Tax=Ilyonectria robusta TaxID=1079257 RepID=UPI001E8E55C4|nr:O-methyltransferase-domain-containing protein [Ilyonectria robusta]KAH8683687.1 O-methyltransferase-domain-containing protein [Ilyonectria robusta]